MKNNLRTRETLVIELHTDTPVGTDQSGYEKVSEYLNHAASILDLDTIAEPRAHISELYGLSGWLPLSEASAIHLYAWDDRQPTFVSVDIATRQKYEKDKLIDYTRKFFEANLKDTFFKESHQDNLLHWQELEPNIWRQRLSLTGATDGKVSDEVINSFLPRLAKKLDMVVLTEPIFADDAAWMHWETSGVLLDRREDTFDLDIYTCKPFDPAAAETFTKENLLLNNTTICSY